MTTERPKHMKPIEWADDNRIGRSTVYKWIKTNQLPHLKVGRNVLIPTKQAEEWLERQIRGGQPQDS